LSGSKYTRQSGYIPRETAYVESRPHAPITLTAQPVNSTRYLTSNPVRRSVSTRRIDFDPVASTSYRVNPTAVRTNNASLKYSSYIPAETRRDSVSRTSNGYVTRNAWGNEVWRSTYTGNDEYDVDSAVDRIIKKSVY
jgi:hypothetical protein